jgi:hypothetical protein
LASSRRGRASKPAIFKDGISTALPKRSQYNAMAKRSANKGQGSLAKEVLHYLINHEMAHDTVEGIVAWWLPEQRIKHAITEVEAALRELAARKFIIARKAPDGRTHYRVNVKKKAAIRRHLKTKTEGSTLS